MTLAPDPSSRILDIEARQDEALRELADLEQRIAVALKEAQPASDSPPNLGIAAEIHAPLTPPATVMPSDQAV
jgi:hypothetical protein